MLESEKIACVPGSGPPDPRPTRDTLIVYDDNASPRTRHLITNGFIEVGSKTGSRRAP